MPIRADSHRRAKLADLYLEIHEHYSPRDPKLACRRVIPEALESRVMLIGEALADDTQRVSEIPYYKLTPAGEPTLKRRGGGPVLDKFLARFGYTIDPGGRGQYAYHTDLACYFPGRKTRPAAEEIARNQPWLEREIQLLEPVVVVTLGLLASASFLQRYAGRRVKKLADVAGIPVSCRVLGRQVDMIAVYHPSGAFQHRDSEAVYRRAAKHIRRILAKAK